MPSAVRPSRVAAVILLATLTLGSLGVPSAFAAPAAPGGLTPDTTSIAGLPVLQWNRVKSATRYDVEVSRSSSFDSTLWKTSTYNRRATPTVQLPGGDIHWRVRSVGSTGTGAWSHASFSRDALAGPAPLGPADGTVLQPPHDPALVSWAPVSGATGYTLQVGKDPQFVDSTLFKTYTTKTASHVVPDPLVATAYHWRVRADLGSGVVTEWSAVQSFSLNGLTKPVLDSPASSPSTSITDVVLDWHPVVGAKTYNLQISTDQNFNTIEHERTLVKGTRYSPPVNLGNDQYYWRVTPVDSAGNTVDWSSVDIWTFRRHWPEQPQLEYPADQSVVGDPFYYQWTPVPHASSYRIQLSTVADFGTLADECTTVNTTFTPVNASDCFPGALGTYYWRVLAYDKPQNDPTIVTDAIAADVNRFTYDPSRVTLLSPAPGDTVEVPTLRWQALPGAAQYDVTITRDDGATVKKRTTGTSWTPTGLLAVDRTYRWQVQPVSMSGRVGASLLLSSQRMFTVVASTATPGATPDITTPAGHESHRFPTLTWQPVTDATQYRVYVRSQGAIGWQEVSDRFAYPAGADAGSTWLTPDTYEWRVEAYNGSALLSGSGVSTFVVLPVDDAAGERVAMSGTAFDGSATCTKVLDAPDPAQRGQCTDLRATPVLTWDAIPEAGGYRVWLSRDQQMTNLVGTYTTDQNIFSTPTALIDSQAGSAFYWWVQPCKRTSYCAAPDYAQHAFNKLSKPVELVSPAPGARVANNVTFTWRDYLATNQDSGTPGSHLGIHSVEPDVEAETYRLQVDDDPNFQSPFETVEVDQTTFTSAAMTYPEGPLYWRVQAIDGSNNALTWSDPGTFEKRSPSVTLGSPVGNETTRGAAPLRWEPLAYAASYDVEVYKNADTIGQSANRVWSGNSRQVAWASTQPLPSSGQSYTWRVRPIDASGRPGPWTDLADPAARFLVVGDAPAPTSPVPDLLLAGNDALFTWDGVDGATSYRFERRLAGSTSNSEVVKTPGLAWAPPSVVKDGTWEWRVVSLNSAGADMGASPWSRFRVDGTAPRVTRWAPSSPAKRTVNFSATFSEPVAGVSGNTVKLFQQGRRGALAAKVSLANGGRKAVLNPKADLRRGKTYRFVLKKGIRDTAGNQLPAATYTVTAR